VTETNKECAHSACGCLAGSGGDYCSESCKDAGKLTEISCKCGHPGCATKAL